MRESLILVCALAMAAPSGAVAQMSGANAHMERIEIAVGSMTFDAIASGPADGELVLLLHGFPQTGYSYRHQVAALAAAGFRAVAPDQRGYSPHARPPEIADYAVQNLVGDVFGMATALGAERFHLVGHDWGGAVAWAAAGAVPDRILSLTVFSTPHLTAFGRALADPDSEQSASSSYFAMFQSEGSEKTFLADDAAMLRGMYGSAMEPEAVEAYLEVLGNEDALRSALNWYRAMGSSPIGGAPAAPLMITVPTLYVFSDQDSAFSMNTAEASAEFVTGPYRFEVLEGVSHWIPDEAPERSSTLLVEHVARYSAGD